jgi:hypothetical protein
MVGESAALKLRSGGHFHPHREITQRQLFARRRHGVGGERPLSRKRCSSYVDWV